jgi:sigma-B regulation protein RsbU (phosphoserine phosphatase)
MRKGAAAAALTSLARYTLRAAACHCPDNPSAVLAELNNTLLADPVADSRFCTALYGEMSAADSLHHAVDGDVRDGIGS